MITPQDEYPFHQTSLPVAHPVDGDPNRYDRFYFNGYDRDAEWFFGVALGVYPNRGVIDAAFSVVRDGVQRNVYASGRLAAERDTAVGPIRIEIVAPLRENRVRVSAEHLGLAADLLWQPRTPAVEEPRQTMLQGTAVVMDATRLVQWGTWSGSFSVEGETMAVQAAPGTKDRSWGVRPVGPGVATAPSSSIPGVYFIWAPVHFADRCTHAVVFEHADGRRWYTSAFSIADGAEPRHAGVEHHVSFVPGTRRAREARLLLDYADGGRDELAFEPLLRFHTKGLGYLHPEWAHGWWRGEAVEGSDAWKTEELDPLGLDTVHVQQLCRVRCGDEQGVGVLEQLILGPHAPSGLTGFLDGAGEG